MRPFGLALRSQRRRASRWLAPLLACLLLALAIGCLPPITTPPAAPSPTAAAPTAAPEAADINGFLPSTLARRDPARMAAYQRNLDFYHGDQWQARSRSRQLVFNYARVAVDKATSYLVTGLGTACYPQDPAAHDPAVKARIDRAASRLTMGVITAALIIGTCSGRRAHRPHPNAPLGGKPASRAICQFAGQTAQHGLKEAVYGLNPEPAVVLQNFVKREQGVAANGLLI